MVARPQRDTDPRRPDLEVCPWLENSCHCSFKPRAANYIPLCRPFSVIRVSIIERIQPRRCMREGSLEECAHCRRTGGRTEVEQRQTRTDQIKNNSTSILYIGSVSVICFWNDTLRYVIIGCDVVIMVDYVVVCHVVADRILVLPPSSR